MTNNIFKQFFLKQDIPTEVKLADYAELLMDCNVFLYHSNKGRFIVIEQDYLTAMPWLTKQMEKQFNLVIEGWCVPLKYQAEVGSDLIAADADDEGFLNGEGPRRALLHDGWYCGLLRVKEEVL